MSDTMYLWLSQAAGAVATRGVSGSRTGYNEVWAHWGVAPGNVRACASSLDYGHLLSAVVSNVSLVSEALPPTLCG